MTERDRGKTKRAQQTEWLETRDDGLVHPGVRSRRRVRDQPSEDELHDVDDPR
ncbi:MAG: hypothetical protein FWF90_05035 [Promicromonosporaceae bacterium]|nr:hypothetical protein [Promicromonosporaceae bacterium]